MYTISYNRNFVNKLNIGMNKLEKLKREYDRLAVATIKSKEDIKHLGVLRQRILKLLGHTMRDIENIHGDIY